MCFKVILVVNLGILMVRADKAMNDTKVGFSKLPVSSNFSDFFSNWKFNSEKMQDIRAENSTEDSTMESENRQRRKELESKLISLQDLYDEKNWETPENEHFAGDAASNARQIPATIYDSLLTRRTFIPSFKTVLIELSLMTLSIVAINAFENAMAQTKKSSKIKKNGYHRLNSDHAEYTNHLALH